MLQVNNEDSRVTSIVNLEQMSHLFLVLQARNKKFFRAEVVLWNLGTLKNISSKTQEKKAPQGKILEFFSLDTFKTTF